MASTRTAARYAERAGSGVSGAAVCVDVGLLVLERTQMGVGERSLGTSAKAQGDVGSRTLESPGSEFYVEWWLLAISTRREGKSEQRINGMEMAGSETGLRG